MKCNTQASTMATDLNVNGLPPDAQTIPRLHVEADPRNLCQKTPSVSLT
jgi:hypothetical protein